MVRDVPSQNPYDDKRTRLYELGPDEIAQITAKDYCSNGLFKDLPTHTERHRQPLLSDHVPSEAAPHNRHLPIS